MNASPPQPAYVPAGPQPQRSGGWVKWVVIGCGCILFLIVGSIAGCYFLVRRGVQAIEAQAEKTKKAWDDLGEKNIKGNAFVEKHLGKVKRVTYGAHRSSTSQGSIVPYRVVGENDEAVVEIEVEMKGFGDMLNPKMVDGFLYYKGKKIDITTGKETDYKGPAKTVTEPPPDSHEED